MLKDLDAIQLRQLDIQKDKGELFPMKKLKGGEYSVSVDLQKGKEYQFKYIIDGKSWLNEKEADKYVVNEFQTKNSVVIL